MGIVILSYSHYEKRRQTYNTKEIKNPKIKTNLEFESKVPVWGFPGGAVVENLPANAEDTGSSPGLGGSHMPRSN